MSDEGRADMRDCRSRNERRNVTNRQAEWHESTESRSRDRGRDDLSRAESRTCSQISRETDRNSGDIHASTLSSLGKPDSNRESRVKRVKRRHTSVCGGRARQTLVSGCGTRIDFRSTPAAFAAASVNSFEHCLV